MAIDSGFNFQTRSSYCCCCSSVQLFFDLYVCIQRTGLMHMFRLVFFFFWWRSVAETALQTGLEYVLQSFYSNESIITGKFLPRCHRKLGGKRLSSPFISSFCHAKGLEVMYARAVGNVLSATLSSRLGLSPLLILILLFCQHFPTRSHAYIL